MTTYNEFINVELGQRMTTEKIPDDEQTQSKQQQQQLQCVLLKSQGKSLLDV